MSTTLCKFQFWALQTIFSKLLSQQKEELFPICEFLGQKHLGRIAEFKRIGINNLHPVSLGGIQWLFYRKPCKCIQLSSNRDCAIMKNLASHSIINVIHVGTQNEYLMQDNRFLEYHLRLPIYTHIYIYRHASSIYIHIYTCVCSCMYAHVHIHKHVYTYSIHICTCIYKVFIKCSWRIWT